MTFKESLKRELYIVIHGQSWRFRVVKYVVLLAIVGALFTWKGLETTVLVFLFLAVVAVGVHFFFRWKTAGWTRSWGPYKNIQG